MTVIVWDGRTLAVDRMAQCGDLKQVVRKLVVGLGAIKSTFLGICLT